MSDIDEGIDEGLASLEDRARNAEVEFTRTMRRLVIGIVTQIALVGLIIMIFDIGPLIDAVGVPVAFLIGFLFPMLLIIAWAGADHQVRMEPMVEEEEHEIEAVVDRIIEDAPDNPLQKTMSPSGGAVYMTRGRDPKGVAEGGGADTFDPRNPQIDGMDLRPEHEGLEGELRKSHEVKIEADEIVAEEAQKAWEEAERNDLELIEAGVGRLGDLVGTGHFGGRTPEN
ncbi:MAG TPA: hypothetical protein HA330_00525 [Candidatus Thalassarchaeaceae archaeon]|nr:MAG TPA: hypothetical protein D7H85_00530 [Candidatus Poseidoniales archaeon]HII48346.1 hypothetical protein [Candidatus Thalassarchaeaceae archaeon]|tara:strand:- start:26 stop:706 length:681 start_codon:yes stop_codon:yes gene_type:complete